MDMMFLLLTFFIFAFALVVRLKVTEVTMPVAKAGAAPERGPTVIVELDESGALRVDDLPTSFEELSSAIRKAQEGRPDAALLIAADERAQTGPLFRLMDELRAAGFSDLKFLRAPADGKRGAEGAPGPASAP